MSRHALHGTSVRSLPDLVSADSSKHDYVKESVGIATGVLPFALHQCSLATLITPTPMGFLASPPDEHCDFERPKKRVPARSPQGEHCDFERSYQRLGR